MLAGEARPFFESIQADLAQADDPQLRSWYETEMSLTPDFQEAKTLQEKLGEFHGLLSQLVERRASTVQGESEVQQSEAEELAEIDDYITPEERKRRSVITWLDTVVEDYQTERVIAQRQPKSSKRERQETIAARRFAGNFERFGAAANHIVYDPEALAIVLEQLRTSHPELAEAVIKNSEAYMYEHGIEFAKNSAAFARLIQQSTDAVLGGSFNRIFSAIYEKKPFLSDPEKAVSLYTSLASAALEVFEGKTHAFYHKVVETAYYKNNIIGPKSAFMAANEVTATIGLGIKELLPLCGELWNARLVNSQYKQAFLNAPFDLDRRSAAESDFFVAARSLGRKYGQVSELEELHNVENHNDYFQRPQHAEDFEVFPLPGGVMRDITNTGVHMPEGLKPHFYAAELYQKRKERLAPRGLIHDVIRSTLSRELGFKPNDITIMDFPISPGLAISYGTNLAPHNILEANGIVIETLLRDFGDKLRAGFYQGLTHEQIARFGELRVDVSPPDFPAIAQVFLRPVIPDDVLLAGGPYTSLITSMRGDALRFANHQEVADRHAEKLRYIAEHRNHYPGRRPIRFRLPELYRERGLQAIEIRQHPDRQHLYVSALHDEGRLEFVFDQDFRVEDRTFMSARTALVYSFEDLVATLAAEWICRPVVETSEGTVSVHEQKSKVNLGYLRYLPVGQNFSNRQRRIFAREQRGSNLAVESLRRKPLDLTGLGRNSTYVRENYDPNKPPLEIYYDPSVLVASEES